MHFLLNDYKIYKGIDSTNTEDDEKISFILQSVEDYIKHQFGIYCQETTVTEKRQAQGDILVVQSYVNSVIGIINKGKSYDVTNVEYIENILYLPYTLTKLVTVSYKTGFTDLPDSIKTAIFIFVDKIYEDVQNNGVLVNSYADPVGGRETFKKSFPKEVYKLLHPYITYKL